VNTLFNNNSARRRSAWKLRADLQSAAHDFTYPNFSVIGGQNSHYYGNRDKRSLYGI
jgi:hypothetical protein